MTGRVGRPPAPRKEIWGVVHKLCKGTAHPKGAWVPLNHFKLIKSGRQAGQYESLCRKCRAVNGGYEISIPAHVLKPALEEMVWRCGKEEAARRMQISPQSLRNYLNGVTKRVRRRNAKKILSALFEARRENIVISATSIHRGAIRRGEQPKRPNPNKLKDFYNPEHDGRNQADRVRHKKLRSHSEIREKQNAQRRKHYEMTGR